MDTDDKDKGVGTSGETGPSEDTDDMQDIMDLLDSALEEDEGGLEAFRIEDEESSGETDEELIDLVDVVDELSEQEAPADEPLELDSEEEPLVEPDALEDEEIMELFDEVKDEASADDEGILELTDLVDDEAPGPGEQAMAFSEESLAAEEPAEDSLPEDLGLALDEGAFDLTLDDEPGEPSAPSMEPGPPPEAAAEVSHEQLESMVAARLSDEKIEEIITRVARETLEKKADKILLEVAEQAIAKEIQKLKQAL